MTQVSDITKLKRPVALVLDLSATGVAVARMLVKHGVEVYGAEAREDTIGNFSRHVKRPSFGYNITLDDQFLEKLLQFGRSFDPKPVLIPADDLYIEFIAEHYELLKDHFEMQNSLHPDISPGFLNKREFYQLCDKHDMPYPKTIFLTGQETIEEVTDSMRFPMILKPDLIHKWKKYLRGKKVMLIETQEMLEELFENHQAIMRDSMLQEVIPGQEDQLYLFKGYFGRDGKLITSFTGRKIRQYPPNFGSASLAESLPNEDVERMSVEFLEAVKFHGLCGSEFKFDARDNVYKMIEINIRPQLWEDLTRIADVEIAWYLYCDLAGLPIPERSTQKNGVKWVYLTRDVFSALWHIRNGNTSMFKWFKSYAQTKADALIDFKDLSMLLRLPMYTLSQIIKYKVKPWLVRSSHQTRTVK
jgi:predicted ATP-grasp superfamily ATP-dependent carboligase